MKFIKQEIEHILHHVNEEAKISTPSQIEGVQDRAQEVRDVLEPLLNNKTQTTRKDLLLMLRTLSLGKATLKEQLDKIDEDDDGDRLQLKIQRYVGKGDVYG